MLLLRIYTVYRVYADGKLIGGSGSIAPTFALIVAANPRLFRLPPGSPDPQTVQVAIRVWEYRPIVSWVGGGTMMPGAVAGDSALLAQRLQSLKTERMRMSVNAYAYGLLATLVGLAILALFLLHREYREYLWFSILFLAGAADAMLSLVGYPDTFPFLIYRLTDEVLVAIGVLAALEFFLTILKKPRSFWWRAVYMAAALSPLSVAIYYLKLAPVGVSYAAQLGCLLPAYVWLIATLTIAFKQNDSSALLLLAPAALLYGAYIIDSIAYIG